jgi:hypothetical protein
VILSTTRWDIDILTRSSIVHRDDYNAVGGDTVSLFRREKVITPNGRSVLVPIVSGSSFRGVLRRIGEELTATILDYEQRLPIPAAHLLTNGGRLAKSARPFTDEQERHLKDLLPQIAVFGGAASGRIMSVLLTVGKVLPELDELAHILPRPPSTSIPIGRALDEESFTRLSDHRPNAGQAPNHDNDEKTSPLGRFSVETLPAGTRLQTWAQITNATDHQVSFFHNVLIAFAISGHLGGRAAAGHGQITAEIHPTVLRGQPPDPNIDWATELAGRRDEALAALTDLT